MNRLLKWLIGAVAAVAIAAGLVFAFIEGRKELAREREREAPVKAPTRVERTASGETVIALAAESRARVNIQVSPLAETEHVSEARAFGTVVDPASLIAIESDFAIAEAALVNSKAQLARTKALFEEEQNASRRTLEAAEAQQRTDAAKVVSAEQHWTLALGDAGAKKTSAERAQLVAHLAQRRAALARVELPPGKSAVHPEAARITLSGVDGPFTVTRAIYVAPTQDERTRGQAFLLLIDSPGAQLLPGAAVTAYLNVSVAKQRGVVLPASAVVRATGLAWAYVQSGDDRYTRREVSTATPVADGWFVTSGFKSGESIVVTGAQTLLSEEFKSQISVGEEAEQK